MDVSGQRMSPKQLELRIDSGNESLLPAEICPHELVCDADDTSGGLHEVRGELVQTVSQPLLVTLRVHNRSGIPIVESVTRLEPGQRQLVFNEWHVLGMEGYSHASHAERKRIADRVWSRRAYGTLKVRPAT